MIKLKCQVCNKSFFVYPRTIKDKSRGKYCSVECSKIGRNKRVKKKCIYCGEIFYSFRNKSEERKYCSIKCSGLGNRGNKNYLWKGENASYRTQHKWIGRRVGKADHCELCGLDSIPVGKKRYFQWANISGEYKRDINDYIQLCLLCHKKFDSKH